MIAVPRLKQYGEHVNDHQIQIVETFFEPRVYKRYKRCFRIKRNFKRNRYIYTKQIRK